MIGLTKFSALFYPVLPLPVAEPSAAATTTAAVAAAAVVRAAVVRAAEHGCWKFLPEQIRQPTGSGFAVARALAATACRP